MDAAPVPQLLYAGAAVCAVVAFGGASVLLDDWRRRSERRRKLHAEREAFRQEVITVAETARARRGTSLAWEGLREMRVAAVVDECVGVKSFYLAAADGRPLPSFHPGQYLTLHLPSASENGGIGGKPVVRCYSLSDRPREEFYRITVKHCPPPTGNPTAPPGLGTTVLHTRVKAGDILPVAAPRGDFFLRPVGREPVALIGAGIGVTPLLSMLLAQCHAGLERETYVILGMRDSSEHPFKQLLEELASEFPNVHLFITYSRPGQHDVEFKDYHRRGRLDMDYLGGVLPFRDMRCLLCGPPAMMQSLAPGLLDFGVPDDRIHFEAFGPASVNRGDKVKSAVGVPVRFARSGIEEKWTEGDTSLLNLAERAGAPLEAGCRVGNCGACAVRLLEGHVTTVRDPGATPGEGECLACISVPTGPVVIEA